VLPPPEGRIAPGQMAPFEAVPASEAARALSNADTGEDACSRRLQTADPNMIHVINLDTRYGIVSVVRHPMDVTAAES
jgi:hypothetical protein